MRALSAKKLAARNARLAESKLASNRAKVAVKPVVKVDRLATAPLLSNSATAVPGQPRGDSGERGSVLAGVVSYTDYRSADDLPSRNTMSKRFMTDFKPGASAGFDLRSYRGPKDYEMWAPARKPGRHRVSQPRNSPAGRVVETGRDFTPVIIRMGEFE